MTRAPLLSRQPPAVARRGIHLDLKGLPPTAERLVGLLPVFAAAGYNCVLVEWEDTFPWTVDARFRNETAYPPETISRFNAEAERLGMEVVPLVQCLGHMETPLSIPDYAPLREVPFMPDVINVLAPGARELIDRMVDDVLSLMPRTTQLHLGGDEAWSFGTHPDTKAYVEKHGKGALYLHHIEPILDRLNARGIRPILWHDMMRDWDDEALRCLAGKADLMVWGYDGHPDTTEGHFGRTVIERFVEHGIPLWGATAYKTGSAQDADRPNLNARQANALAWAEVAQRYDMRGVVATGWSRWTTLSLQTVPIDGALDAAFLVGAILHDGELPENAGARCLEALAAVGERTRFEACCDALEDLAQRRQANWESVRLLREMAVLASQDPRKRPATPLRHWHGCLRHGIKETEEAAAKLHSAFEGLVDAVWLKRYCDERIEPLRQEADAMEPLAREFDPEGYAAWKKGEA